MKHVFTFIVLLFCGMSFAQSHIKFEKDTVDLGTITVEIDSLGHEVIQYIKMDFPFINSGNEPLIITSVTGSGNGIADYPKDPMVPKQKGIIKATFTRFRYTAYLKKGEELRPFATSILVQGNFPGGQTFICIKGFVKKAKKK